jgi:cellulose synthase (UDP-forming)
MPDHLATVELWRPDEYPSVDIFLPSAGENVDVLANTFYYVGQIRWPGAKTVYVLDDKGSREVEELAESYGYTYLARLSNDFKKAGNLQYAYERSSGDHIVIFDADFVPRDDFLHELLPYMDDEWTGIVQSPQFFSTEQSMDWLERTASATQEMFYRFIQPSRDAVGAAICVGTSAVYRRKAINEIGGFPLIGHSEDLFTGVLMHRRGYRLQYVPAVLSRGQCPDNLHQFISQQYRWAEGSLAMLQDPAFHTERSMTFNQRLSFWAGFLYYITTAMNALLAPVALLVMAFFFPQNIQPINMLPLVGVVLLWTAVMPLVSKTRWRFDVLRVQTIYGFAHLFCIMDSIKGRVSQWIPTGSATVHTPLGERVRRTMIWYLSISQALLIGALTSGALRYGLDSYWANFALVPLNLYVYLPVIALSLRSAPQKSQRKGGKTHEYRDNSDMEIGRRILRP